MCRTESMNSTKIKENGTKTRKKRNGSENPKAIKR